MAPLSDGGVIRRIPEPSKRAMARCLAVLTALLASAAPADTVKVPVEGGAALHAALLVPSGAGRGAALVVAPGQSYDRNQPLTRGLAEAAHATGFVTLRFDWRSHSAGSAPPESSLASELADMHAAIAYLRQHARVDPARIYVAGKSLGSLVAHRAFVSDARIRAAVLLTPIVRRRGDGERNYPRPTTQARPWLVVLGEADPLCPLPNLYDWLATSGATAPVAVFAGDHLLNVVPETAADPAPNQRNVQQAIAATVHWLRECERTAR